MEETRSLDVAELAPLALSPEERAAFDALPPDKSTERFYELWTLKEAYAKARGFGLSLPFPEIVLEADCHGWRLVRAPEDTASWRLVTMRPTDRHRLAVAAQTPKCRSLSVSVASPSVAQLRPTRLAVLSERHRQS